MAFDYSAELFAQQLANGVARGSTYALVAVGYTMVYGVLQLINFAHSDVYMLGAYFSYYPARWLGYSDDKGRLERVPFYWIVLICLFAMACCAIVGMLIERFAYKPLRKAGRLAPLITAIGVALFLEYGGQMVFGTSSRQFPDFMDNAQRLTVGPVALPYTKLVIIVVAAMMMTGLWLFVQKTRPGRAMRAISCDMKTASLMGINVNRTISLTFALGSALAAVGGILVGIDLEQITPLMGLRMGLKAFVAAVLGGIGSIPGAALGGLLLGVCEAVVGGKSTTYQEAVAFVILIVILLVKPTGLLGKAGREKV